MKFPKILGASFGTAAGCWLIAEHYMEMSQPAITALAGYVGYFVFFTALFLGIWLSREKELGGLINFKTAMRAGVLTAVYYSIVLGLFTFINYTYINTDYLIAQKPDAGLEEIAASKSIFRIAQGVIIMIPFSILFGTAVSAVF